MDREANFWGRINENLWRPNRKLDRIENGVLDGMPDTYIVIEGSMNWAELKCPSEPAREDTPLFSGSHKLSISQRNWLLAHRQAGGRGWVAIETENWVFLVRAQLADMINRMPLSWFIAEADFAAPRPMKTSDWEALAITLRSKHSDRGSKP